MVASWRAFLWSTVCFSNSFWICGSIKFVIYTSLMSTSSLFSKSHFFPVLRVFRRSGPVFPQSRLVKKKTCLLNFIFWALMSASSTRVHISTLDNVSTMRFGFLLLIILGPSTPILKKGDRLSVCDLQSFVSAQYAKLHQTMTIVLPVNILLRVSGVLSPIPLVWWA